MSQIFDDGDTLSLTMVMTDEAREEIQKKLNSKEYYVDDTGNLMFSSSIDTLDAVLKSMT